MYIRSEDDETFRQRSVKYWKQIKDNQSFDTDLNLIRDLAGSLVRISITSSKGSSWLLHISLPFLLSCKNMMARSKDVVVPEFVYEF